MNNDADKTESPDALIDEVRRTRRRLVAEHGGLKGWVRYLQQCQDHYPERVIPTPKRTT